jgi:hypothetical protein
MNLIQLALHSAFVVVMVVLVMTIMNFWFIKMEFLDQLCGRQLQRKTMFCQIG